MKWIEELIKLRNELYEDLPKGEISSWELLSLIKLHINDLDSLIHRNSATLPSSSVTGEEVKGQKHFTPFYKEFEGLEWESSNVTTVDEDEIYEIDDIDTVREMLIKAKKSSYQWCKKAMEAANHRIQLQQTIKELSVAGEEVKYAAMSPNNTELIQGWYKDAKGSNFQLIKINSPVTGESEAIGERKFTLEDVQRLVKVAYTDASGIYKDVPCVDWWPEFKLHNNL